MTKKSNEIIGGINIICGSMLPSNTIYCSTDVFFALKKSTKSKGILEKLKALYENKGDEE